MKSLAHFLSWSLGFANAETQTTAAERRALAAHAAGLQRIVEIGVWHGVTTRLLRGAMAPDGVIWAVDPFTPGRLGVSLQQIIARSTVNTEPNGRVRWARTLGSDAAVTYASAGERPADMIFIDGDHSIDVVRADWEAWSALVAPGGVICLHDTRSTADRHLDDAGSAIFARTVLPQDRRFTLLEVVDSMTILRRVGNVMENAASRPHV